MKGQFESHKGRGLRVGPKKVGVLVSEKKKGVSDVGVFWDEMVIKVAETKKVLDVFEELGSRPIINGL